MQAEHPELLTDSKGNGLSSSGQDVERIVGSPLSDRLILAHMEVGNIVISPFKDRNLQNSSYDVSLGRYYYAEQEPGPDFTLFNPYNFDHVKRVWGESQQAVRA